MEPVTSSVNDVPSRCEGLSVSAVVKCSQLGASGSVCTLERLVGREKNDGTDGAGDGVLDKRVGRRGKDRWKLAEWENEWQR